MTLIHEASSCAYYLDRRSLVQLMISSKSLLLRFSDNRFWQGYVNKCRASEAPAPELYQLSSYLQVSQQTNRSKVGRLMGCLTSLGMRITPDRTPLLYADFFSFVEKRKAKLAPALARFVKADLPEMVRILAPHAPPRARSEAMIDAFKEGSQRVVLSMIASVPLTPEMLHIGLALTVRRGMVAAFKSLYRQVQTDQDRIRKAALEIALKHGRKIIARFLFDIVATPAREVMRAEAIKEAIVISKSKERAALLIGTGALLEEDQMQLIQLAETHGMKEVVGYLKCAQICEPPAASCTLM